jgi:hypothetical protein
MPLDAIKNDSNIILEIRECIINFLLKFPGIEEIYEREEGILSKVKAGELGFISVAPFIRLSASYLALEIIFSFILNTKRMIKAPEIIGFDYLRMRSFSINLNLDKK